MFANGKEADAVVDGPFGKKLHAKLEDKGLVGLAYWELGFRNITNSKRPINKVEDIAGLKLRVIPNADQRRLGQGAGRQPDAAALPRGVRRAGAKGHRRPGKPAHRDRCQQVLRSAEVPDADQPPVQPAVGDVQQEVLGHADCGRERRSSADAAVEATAYQRQQARAQAATALEAVKKGGMQVTELPPAEVAKLRDKMKPVIAKYAVSVGQDTVKDLQDELAAARK